MADFCAQCSIEMFEKDFGDLAGQSTAEHTAAGLYPIVLCEGCGPIQVDHTGRCVSTDCVAEPSHVAAPHSHAAHA
jgi:hypothetical protein